MRIECHITPKNIRVSELMETFVNPSKSHQGLLRGWSRRDLLAKVGDGREHGENIQDQILEGQEKRKQNINLKARDQGTQRYRAEMM